LAAAEPARDATVSSLTAVRLRFTDPLRPEFSTVAVTATDDARVVSGSPAVAGTEITVPVTVTGGGSYTVAYRVLSADGHPVEGSYAVSLAPQPAPHPGPPSTSAAVPASTPPSPPPSTEPTEVVPTGTAWTATGAGVGGTALVGVGTGLVVCTALLGAGLVWRRRRREQA
jgi:methionine-rich copper-binding protein CopC